MTKSILMGAAVLYWICFLCRFYLWNKDLTLLARLAGHAEKFALLVFTAGLVFYIGKLQIIDGEVRSMHYDMPVSFLLFAWAISAANVVTEIAYNNRWSALFANFWTGLALTLSPAASVHFEGIFTYDLEWLSFHRLCFLLGYAFCALAFPLVVFFLFSHWRFDRKNANQNEKQRLALWNFDRMSYRMILWALPLLTAGIITESLLLLEVNQLPSPGNLWLEKQETLLALTAWFLCGIYLHARLFFGWKNLRAASLYLTGLALLLIGHFTHGFSRHG